MFVIVSYDIPDDKRRTKVMKTLCNFGAHVQYSVFECDLSRENYQRLRLKLQALVDPGEDNVRFYVLSEEDRKKRRVWGPKQTGPEVQPFYVIGGSKGQEGE